jgi:hypothetical protein
MKKISTVEIDRVQVFKENRLTIGLDLGCWVLDYVAHVSHCYVTVRRSGFSRRRDSAYLYRRTLRSGDNLFHRDRKYGRCSVRAHRNAAEGWQSSHFRRGDSLGQ